MVKHKHMTTPWGEIQTPRFVWAISIFMILFSVSTIDLKLPVFLKFLLSYGSDTIVYLKFGIDILIFGGVWLLSGRLGFKKEVRHYGTLIFCFAVSVFIIMISHPNQNPLEVSINTVNEFLNWTKQLL